MSDFLKFVRENWLHIFAMALVLTGIVGFNFYIVKLANSQSSQCAGETTP